MIIKNKIVEQEVKRHLTHTVTVCSYYDGKKIGEKVYHLACEDEINVKMTQSFVEVKME